ncbi:MAG: hypothetical protein ACD_75C01325G0001 [uncultured bacterium]|nr:MAG: hypothetical protein ACD_75C01325G0001 [uncultured bacterium]
MGGKRIADIDDNHPASTRGNKERCAQQPQLHGAGGIGLQVGKGNAHPVLIRPLFPYDFDTVPAQGGDQIFAVIHQIVDGIFKDHAAAERGVVEVQAIDGVAFGILRMGGRDRTTVGTGIPAQDVLLAAGIQPVAAFDNHAAAALLRAVNIAERAKGYRIVTVKITDLLDMSLGVSADTICTWRLGNPASRFQRGPCHIGDIAALYRICYMLGNILVKYLADYLQTVLLVEIQGRDAAGAGSDIQTLAQDAVIHFPDREDADRVVAHGQNRVAKFGKLLHLRFRQAIFAHHIFKGQGMVLQEPGDILAALVAAGQGGGTADQQRLGGFLHIEGSRPDRLRQLLTQEGLGRVIIGKIAAIGNRHAGFLVHPDIVRGKLHTLTAEHFQAMTKTGVTLQHGFISIAILAPDIVLADPAAGGGDNHPLGGKNPNRGNRHAADPQFQAFHHRIAGFETTAMNSYRGTAGPWPPAR